MNESNQSVLQRDYEMMAPMEDNTATSAAFRLHRVIPLLKRFWWVPVATMFLCLAGAGAYVWSRPPAYVSKSRMWETLKVRLPEGNLFTEDLQSVLGTQNDLLQSAALKEEALKRLEKDGGPKSIARGSDGEALPVAIRVTQTSKSAVFLLEATSSNPKYAQGFLNALMPVYIEYKNNTRKKVSSGTLNSISSIVKKAEEDLKAEQELLAAFQRTNKTVMPEEEGRAAGGQLANLKVQLSNLELDNEILEATSTNAASALTLESGVTPPTTNTSSLSPGARVEQFSFSRELENKKIELEKFSKVLRPKHPRIVQLEADIRRGNERVEFFRNQTREQLAATRQSNQVRIARVKTALGEWTDKVVAENNRLTELERMKFNVQRLQNVCDRLATLSQSVEFGRVIDQESLDILEYAGPAKRSYAKMANLLGVAGIGGLCAGLAIVGIIAFRDDYLRSPLEINEKLGERIVGQVPEVITRSPNTQLALLESDDDRHAYAESFRCLRSALVFMAVETERPRVVLVTSAVPHEGKSTVAANLARALALGGSRVALVDGDLRKGVLHHLMHLQQSPGLAEVLHEPGCLEEVIQTNSMSNLGFISSGNFSGHCGDALLKPAFAQTLARLRELFDYVVIDSSPVFAADDATTLAPKVDGTLFVVRSRFSRTGPVRDALDLLYQRQARVLGVIFNQAEASQRSNYYYKYADYYAAGKSA